MKKYLLPAALVLALTTSGLAVLPIWSGAPVSIPAFEAVRAGYQSSDALLYDREGRIIHELRIDPSARRLDWIPLESISPAMRSASVFAEDRRFRQHRGIDWRALASAAAETVLSDRRRGASTISMQLASLLEPHLKPQELHRSLQQKWNQVRAAWLLEQRWNKDEILEAYLNLITFRGELQGVAAASRGLFGKVPHGLDLSESLTLAALIRSPNAAPETVRRRAVQLAEAMGLKVPESHISRSIHLALSGNYRVEPRADLAPHLARRLLPRHPHSDGITSVQSTLHSDLQRFASEVLRRQLLRVQGQNVRDGAVLVVDNRSGDVLAYVGNGGETSSARYVDGIQAARQAGSTLKPFLYALAFERRILTAASLIEDSPLNLAVSGGVYRPTNYDNQFRGPVTARVALASSLNVPAVRVLNLLGIESFVEQLRTLKLRDLRSADFYGPSLALGSADVTLWDLVGAYRALACAGLWSPLRLTVEDPTATAQRAYSPQTAFLISSILSDRESRSTTFGLESPLSTRYWSAVKTGTSKDMRDNWCLGYSEHYTVGVWVGNFSGASMWNVSGISGAAPVWLEVMNRLHRSRPSLAPSPPQDVVEQWLASGVEALRNREWFREGTETDRVQVAPRQAAFKIAYPGAGTVIAIDPDIPDGDQRVFFEAAPRAAHLNWVLDGLALGPASGLVGWKPISGSHRLSLVDSEGNEQDAVPFVVR